MTELQLLFDATIDSIRDLLDVRYPRTNLGRDWRAYSSTAWRRALATLEEVLQRRNLALQGAADVWPIQDKPDGYPDPDPDGDGNSGVGSVAALSPGSLYPWGGVGTAVAKGAAPPSALNAAPLANWRSSWEVGKASTWPWDPRASGDCEGT